MSETLLRFTFQNSINIVKLAIAVAWLAHRRWCRNLKFDIPNKFFTLSII